MSKKLTNKQIDGTKNFLLLFTNEKEEITCCWEITDVMVMSENNGVPTKIHLMERHGKKKVIFEFILAKTLK